VERGTVGRSTRVAATRDPEVLGTVTGLITTTHYALGRGSVVLGVVLVGTGLCGLGATLWSRTTLAPWVLPAVLLAAVAGLAGLSRARRAAGIGDRAARRCWAAVGAGAWVAIRPTPVRADLGATDRRLTRAQRFDVVDVSGSRATCEYLGPVRRRAPGVGAVVEVYGFRLRDGTVWVQRIVNPPDGSTFTPRADLAFALARFTVGLATAAGVALTLLSLLAMTLRGL
jgi:hypothetical protein